MSCVSCRTLRQGGLNVNSTQCKESIDRGRASAFSFVSRRKDGKVGGPHLALDIILSERGMGKEGGRTGCGRGKVL